MDFYVYGDWDQGYHVHNSEGAAIDGPYDQIEQALAAIDDHAAPHLCPECGRCASND